MNRFKGLQLVNSVPEKLWTELHNIVQEAANNAIPKKKRSRKAKRSSEEASQIAKARREEKSKERHIQLSSDFRMTVWRDKKTFFSEQCIKLETI